MSLYCMFDRFNFSFILIFLSLEEEKWWTQKEIKFLKKTYQISVMVFILSNNEVIQITSDDLNFIAKILNSLIIIILIFYLIFFL